MTEIHSSEKVFLDFDYVVSAIPAFALTRIIDDETSFDFPDFNYSPILNIHIWLENKYNSRWIFWTHKFTIALGV